MTAVYIWEQCELMRLMTKSQIYQYQLECDNLLLKPTALRERSISDYLRNLMEPFKNEMQINELSVQFSVD
jgi:hypothetical protein